MLKTLTKNDTTTTPYVATKDWNLSNVANEDVVLAENGNPIAAENVDYFPTEVQANYNCNVAKEDQELDLVRYREGLKTSGLFYPDLDPKNLDGTYKRMVYTQIKTMFYNNFRDPTKVWGSEKFDFDTSQTKKFLSDSIKLFDVPTIIMGQKIVEKSVFIVDNTLDNDYLIVDDGNCNLFAGTNLFSKQQEIGYFQNIFQSGSYSGCDSYFNFENFVDIFSPNAPINLSASLVTTDFIDSGSLTWDDNSNNEDGFYISRSIDNGTTWVLIDTLGPNITTYLDTTLTTGSSIYVVGAFNSIGVNYSNTASLETTFTQDSFNYA